MPFCDAYAKILRGKSIHKGGWWCSEAPPREDERGKEVAIPGVSSRYPPSSIWEKKKQSQGGKKCIACAKIWEGLTWGGSGGEYPTPTNDAPMEK